MSEVNKYTTQTFVPAEEFLEQIRPFLISIVEDAIERHFAKDETPLPDQTVAERIGRSLTTLWRWKNNGKIGSVFGRRGEACPSLRFSRLFGKKW